MGRGREYLYRFSSVTVVSNALRLRKFKPEWVALAGWKISDYFIIGYRRGDLSWKVI
jgi:hypothetical protein